MITIRYSNGSARLGWILSLAGAVLRVAIQGQEDAAVFNMANGCWLSEQGDEVQFEFGMGLEDATRLMHHLGELRDLPRPSACAAGGECVFRQVVSGLPN